MKKLTICMALLASTSAFAGPVQDGTFLFISGKALVLQNAVSAALTKSDLAARAADLKEVDVKNAKLKAVYTSCADNLLVSGTKEINENSVTYVENLSSRLTKAYGKLKEGSAGYDSAVNCKDCDTEIKKLTVEKYLNVMYSAVEDLQRLNKSVFPAILAKEISEKRTCNLAGFYNFVDSKKFTDLKSWNFGSYGTGVSPAEILDGSLADSLDLIARKAPITVNRSASLLGKSSSEYKNGQVNMKLTYDSSIITGPDNVVHPELTNPLDIIQRDR
jgi:hypothetical protein